MHDADAWRHDLEGVKRLHSPLEKLVSLAVALELQLQVFIHRILGTREVHLYRVIHHKIHWHKRLDNFWILPQALHGRAHRSQVNQQRHAGKILQDDSRHGERNLLRALRVRLPRSELTDILLSHLLPVEIPQHRLQHQTNARRETGNIPQPRLCQRR